MATQESIAVARRAREIYEQRLRSELEASHPDEFVAIEPDSGDFFLGNTLSEAIQAARSAYCDKLAFAIRVGHTTAVDLGVMAP